MLVLVCIAVFVASGCAPKAPREAAEPTGDGVLMSDASDELVVCISGMVTPQEGQQYYQGLSEYVAQKAGKKLRLIHKADYAELNELLKSGEVDLAFSCSGPYVAAHEEFGLELLAAPVVAGTMTYQAYVIVPVASTATSLEDLRGTTFAFTDPESNTGTMVPTYMLAMMDTTPEKFFGRVIYTYSHDNSIRAVAQGDVDGASVDSLIWEYANDTDPVYTSQTKILTASTPYGIPPVVVRPGLDPALKVALRDAFLNADEDPAGKALLDHMHIERFEVIEDSAYDSVREIDRWISEH
jgi:phosphonate transport system substrate-binding protein